MQNAVQACLKLKLEGISERGLAFWNSLPTLEVNDNQHTKCIKKRINVRIQGEGRDFNSGNTLNILFWWVFFTNLHEV